MEDIIFCKGGGCTAKLGAGTLSRILEKLPGSEDPDLLVGFGGSDDVAVYRLSEDLAVISTLDFFPPMIEDPYLFGAIAAANAMSDIYAMGGEVKTALNIVCFPESMDMNVLGKIMQGGCDKVMEAGGSLAGGHSIADDDIKYGLSVTGTVHPERIYRNSGCREGDALILTKKLGTGIIMTAHRINMADDEAVNQAVESMTFLNKYAADILKDYDVHACTDVTGFGFLAHLCEMLGDERSAVVERARIPYFDRCREYVEEFYITAAAQKNRNHVGEKAVFEPADFFTEEILFDPQTSGGLLVSVSAGAADEIKARMNSEGIPAEVVGYVTEKQERTVTVR